MKTKRLLTMVVFLLILVFSLVACDGNVGDITINGFTIDTSNLDLDLLIGEDIDLTKLVVTATMTDGTTITLIQGEDFTVDLGNFDKTQAGEYTIKVKYKEYPEKTFVVKVTAATAPALTSIAIAADSNHKTAFAYNENFSSANLAITATYNNETTARITEGLQVNSSAYIKAHGLASEQSYTITVSYQSKTTTYGVSVAADPSKLIKGIKAVGTMKKSYKYAEEFSSDGLQLEVTMMDDSKSYLTSGFEIDSSAYNKLHKSDEAQSYDVILSYMGKTTSYEVTVARAKIIGLYLIGVDFVNFEYGADFNCDTLKVFAKYENTSYTEELTYSTEAGEGKFTIDSSNYEGWHNNGYETFFDIFVVYDDDISLDYTVMVRQKPSFSFYRIAPNSQHPVQFGFGDLFSYQGLIIEAVYLNSYDEILFTETVDESVYTIEVPSEFVGNNVPDEYGFYEICVSLPYSNSVYYQIYVTDGNDAVESIYANISITEFVIGTEFFVADGYIGVSLAGGDGYCIYLPNSLVTISGFDSSTIGQGELIFTYKGVSSDPIEYSIIEDEIVDVDIIIGDNFRRDYYIGEEFVLQDVQVYNVYRSGKRELKQTVEYDASGYQSSAAGSYYINIEDKIDVDVTVYNLIPATEPGYIILYPPSDGMEIYSGDLGNGNWETRVDKEGEYEIFVYLDDYLSYYDIMLGRYFPGDGGIFLPLINSGGDYVYFDGINDIELTIRITNANGNVWYHYLTIIKDKSTFDSITINGQELELSRLVEYNFYRIDNISNTYVFDWTIDSKYTVHGITKGQTVKLPSYDSNNELTITVREGDEDVDIYKVVIKPYLFVKSLSIGEYGIGIYDDDWGVMIYADFTTCSEESYAINVEVPQNYTAKFKHGGKTITAIDADILFVGDNYFVIEVYDGNNNYVTEYDVVLQIRKLDFVPNNAYIKNAEGTILETLQADYRNVMFFAAELSSNTAYRIEFRGNSGPTLSQVTIVGYEEWENGDEIVFTEPGLNMFVVRFTYNNQTVQTYMLIYVDASRPGGYDWQNVIIKVAGERAYETAVLPNSSDIWSILIPEDFEFSNDISDDMEILPGYGIDISPFNYDFELIEEGKKIRITVTDKKDDSLDGYLYVFIVREGLVSSDATLYAYSMSLMDLIQDKLDNRIEFQQNSEDASKMEATINSSTGNYLIFQKLYLVKVEIEDVSGALLEEQEGYYYIAYEGESFELIITVTANDRITQIVYYLTVNLSEVEKVVSISIGDTKLEYSFIEIMEKQNEGVIFIELESLKINPDYLDTVNHSVTLRVDSIFTVVATEELIPVEKGTYQTYYFEYDPEDDYYYYDVVFYFGIEEIVNPDNSFRIYLQILRPYITMTVSDGTVFAIYGELGDFEYDDDIDGFRLYLEEEYFEELLVDGKFIVDLFFRVPDFICFYDEEEEVYLSEVNGYELEFVDESATIWVCYPAPKEGEPNYNPECVDEFMPIVITVITGR